MLYLWLALVAVFIAGLLAVLGGGEWIANRVSKERGVYERVVGKELYRLFMDISPQEFVLIHLVCIAGGLGLGWVLLGNLLGALTGALVGYMGPRWWLKKKWEARVDAVNDQVEEAMVYMANAFKANPSLPDAIADVTKSMPAPISQELQVMLREYKLGTPLDKCLIRLQRRMPARNLELAISALIVGRAVGGNIPKILEDIASTIRESYRLERVIDSQTAQGRMQAWVMGAMPAGIVGVFHMLDPTLTTPLFNTWLGYLVLAIALILNLFGVMLILKIVKIRV